MIDYEYTGKTSLPNLDGIHSDVAASEMTNKSIAYCVWAEEDETLCVYWNSHLSTADKILLDAIVEANS